MVKPFGADLYRPFPVDALPSPIREYVSEGAASLGCDPAYIALPVITVCAAAIGNSRTIQLKADWSEPCVVWAAIVGESGTLKSPAWGLAVDPLIELEELARAPSPENKSTRVSITPTSRYVCADTTIERLAEILEDNLRGVLLARDELSGWFGSQTRYKGKQGGTDLPNWLEIHRAGRIIVDRKTGDRRSIRVARAAVSVTGGIQPGVLIRAMTPEFLESGFSARLLMAMPPRKPKKWSDSSVSSDVKRRFSGLLTGLVGLDFDAEGRPHPLGLSPAALNTWKAFYNSWAEEQSQVEGELAAAYSKLEGYAARFALLHHVVTHAGRAEDDRVQIEEPSIRAGILLARWFAREFRRIYGLLAESADARRIRRLLEWIHLRGGRSTAKDLQRSNGRRYPTSEAATRDLDVLVQMKYGKWIDREPGEVGGRPTRDFILDPTTDQTDETDEHPGAANNPPQEEPIVSSVSSGNGGAA